MDVGLLNSVIAAALLIPARRPLPLVRRAAVRAVAGACSVWELGPAAPRGFERCASKGGLAWRGPKGRVFWRAAPMACTRGRAPLREGAGQPAALEVMGLDTGRLCYPYSRVPAPGAPEPPASLDNSLHRSVYAPAAGRWDIVIATIAPTRAALCVARAGASPAARRFLVFTRSVARVRTSRLKSHFSGYGNIVARFRWGGRRILID